jgi:hypothetical protein
LAAERGNGDAKGRGEREEKREEKRREEREKCIFISVTRT